MFRNTLILAIFSLISFPILAQPPGYRECSPEGGVCNFGFDGINNIPVAYGANGSFAFRTFHGVAPCNYAEFGVDPAPGIAKACYLPTDPPGFIPCAAEGKTCIVSNTNTAAFGANGHFVYYQFTGNFPCTSTAFRSLDPAPGVAENCFIAAPPPNYGTCSAEGATCSFHKDSEIAFGGNGNFVFRRFTNQTATVCNPSAFFGVDPAPGTTEQCFNLGFFAGVYPPPSGYIPYGYSLCSAENGTCNFNTAGPIERVGGPFNVAYGANGNFVFKIFWDGIACTNTTFGVDPAPGIVKVCYIPTIPPGFTQCANENGTCSFLGTGTAPVAYGANGNFIFKNLTNGSGCNNTVFGVDPAPGTAKACYIPAGPASYTFCSSENGACNFTSFTGGEIFYGWNGAFTSKSFPAGGVICNNSTFGIDPAPGIDKACFAGVPFTF